MKVMKVHAWKWRPAPYLVLLSFFLFWMHKSTNSALFYSCLTKSPLSFLLLVRSWRDGVKLNLPYSQSLGGPRILSLPQPGLFFFTSSYLWLPEMNVNRTHSGWACQGLRSLWGKFFPFQHLMEVGVGGRGREEMAHWQHFLMVMLQGRSSPRLYWGHAPQPQPQWPCLSLTSA